MKSYLFILFTILGISLSSCPGPVCCSDPGPQRFSGTIITNEGHDYLKDIAEDTLKVYFFENGKENLCEVDLHSRDDKTYFGARYIEPGNETRLPISWISADRGINEFYIDVEGDIDTLNIYINNKREYERVLFNGEKAQQESDRSGIYILQK